MTLGTFERVEKLTERRLGARAAPQKTNEQEVERRYGFGTLTAPSYGLVLRDTRYTDFTGGENGGCCTLARDR